MKSVGMAYVLWMFGFHRFYLGRPVSGLLYLMTCGGIGLWGLLDLLLIPGIVNEENAAFASLFAGKAINIHVGDNHGRRRRRRDDDD